MTIQPKKQNLNIIIIAVLTLIILSITTLAISFDFDPTPPTTFNLTEDQSWTYDVNVTVNENLVNFSMEDTPYANLTMNPVNGLMEFTPTNDEVGVSGYYLIIVRNKSNPDDLQIKNIRFNISNVNDAPNITYYFPTDNNKTMDENTTQKFNFTATDDDLIHDDLLNTTWFLNGSVKSFNDTWNYTPGFCDAGSYNITLLVNDTADSNQFIYWNITVRNNNRAPIQNQTFDNKTWQEGTNLTNNLTLSDYFDDLDKLDCNDDFNKDNLTYNAIGNSTIEVIININSTNVSFKVAPNWFGVEIINFTASDGLNTTISNPVTLNVTNINDPPEFNYSNQTLFADVSFNYDINATDPDNEIQPGTDNLIYYDNASVFNIDSNNGIISFTPSNSDVAIHPVNISVYDGTVNTSALVYFNVSSNNAPVISPIGDQTATEGIFFKLNVTATDADSDTLTFSTNFSRFNIFTINISSVNLSFLPGNNDVGNHTINISVVDTQGARDYEVINLEVLNVNNQPILNFIANQTLVTDKLFTLYVTGSDNDTDSLTFHDNVSFFNIQTISSTQGLINFTPASSDVGVHPINISAADPYSNASQTVYFTISLNLAPVLATIGNWSIQEDSFFSLQVNATDPNNESLTFATNSTIFNFSNYNSTSKFINFTPTQNNVGSHWINITVNDTVLIDSELLYINVTLLNESPSFTPIPSDMNASVARFFIYDLNATDEEGDFFNFTSNSTLFNVSAITGQFNFTPVVAQIGNYTINFSVSDGTNINSSVILFSVVPKNRAPQIISRFPNISNTNISEGLQITFNITVTDADSDPINYTWTLNGTEKSYTYEWIYEPGYTTAGFYNVTVVVSDGSLENRTFWNLTVNDTNRRPSYGIKNHTAQSDFNGGTLQNINTTGQSGNITLSKSDGTNYFAEGNFTSQVIDLGSGTNLTLVNLSWQEQNPENTTIVVQFRSSSDGVTFTNFTGNNTINYTDPSGTSINILSQRYVQYKIILTTNNSNTSPTIEHIAVHYKISDFIGNEDTVYLNYIDLDNYFNDLDGDTLTYNYSGNTNVEISIDSTNKVTLTPASNWYGTENVMFTAYDSKTNISSRNISLTFIDVVEPAGGTEYVYLDAGGGGGGGGSGGGGRIYLNKSIIVNQSKSVEIIVPENIHVGLNEEIIVPLKIQNNEDYVMNGIFLSATSNSELTMDFFPGYIKTLESNDKKLVELKIEPSNITRSFIVKVAAVVTEPDINDTATISVNINENISQKISYVRDFLRLNPECLELDELALQAKVHVQNHNYDQARVLLDKAIDNCKFLLSAKRMHIEDPTDISIIRRIIRNPYFKLIVILLILALSLTLSYVGYNRWKWY